VTDLVEDRLEDDDRKGRQERRREKVHLGETGRPVASADPKSQRYHPADLVEEGVCVRNDIVAFSDEVGAGETIVRKDVLLAVLLVAGVAKGRPARNVVADVALSDD
jgi:hypothetical protein